MITRRIGLRGLGIGLVGCLLVGWCSLGGCCAVDRHDTGLLTPPLDGEDNSRAPLATVTLESKPLPSIPTGTVIGKTAPEGWTKLILIGTPTLTKEDLRDAPRIAAHYAQMFKFTLLARTSKVKDRHQLDTVARGFAIAIRGKETIVDSRRTLGADMGAFGARILAENEKCLDNDVRQIARTPTMLLFDAQAVMRQGSDHVRMVNRHAILVDPATGQIHTLIWLLTKDRSGYGLADKAMQLIPDSMREQRLLSVKRDRFVLGMPTAEAFALVRIPQGTAVAYTPELEKLAGVKELTKEQVPVLEKALLAAASAARK